jgi:hypothetical protein
MNVASPPQNKSTKRRSFLSPQRLDRPLFPLRLTPFELYMLLDDGPSHPMQFFCRLRCRGEIRVDCLDAAVGQATARHPLLSAVVRPVGPKRFEWIAAKRPTVHWLPPNDGEDLVEPPFIDIRKSPGLTITCRPTPDGVELVFAFHHAACDGLAAMDFMVDVLVGYANAVLGENRFGLKRLDVERLRFRGRSGLTRWQWGAWCLRNAWRLPDAYRFYKRRPAPLLAHPLDNKRPLRSPSVCQHRFSPDESRQLQTTAKQLGTTVNTLLLRDLFLTCRELSRESHDSVENGWLRATVPLTMRAPADRQLPAANLVSLGFVDRPMAALQHPEALLRGIDASLQKMIERRWGLGFLTGLTVMREFPDTLAKYLQRNRCYSSVLLTNFGTALPGCCLPRSAGRLVAGNLLLEDIEFAPLLRPLQVANFAVTQYAGRFFLGMRFDSRHLDPTRANIMLNRYVAQIGQSASMPNC